MSASYEDIHALVRGLRPAASDGERDVRWITDTGVVGLARARDGKIEVFLQGARLTPVSTEIREAIEHQFWFRRSKETELEANRILLPAVGFYDQVAAFICTELLRNGADDDLFAAFRKTEPIIELAIKRLRLSDQALLGLAGELLLLDALCARADDEQVGVLVVGWHGWRESRRDFALGKVGVEVKTTTRATSSHRVQGLHQVEPMDGASADDTEERLLLVSIGVHWNEGGSSFRIPLLVDSIVRRLDDAGRSDLVDILLAHVREYGGGSEGGYDHATMAGDLRFRRGFVPQFVRAYDMSDPAIKVLRSDVLAPYSHVPTDSVTFAVDLPNRASGNVNPKSGLHATAAEILTALP